MKFIKPQLLLVGILLASCVSDVDFDQVDDIEINTPHNISLAYFNLDSEDFLDDMGNELIIVSDTTEFPFFNNSGNENYLVQADFQFEATNTFDRDIIVQFKFLDESENDVYEFELLVVEANNTSFEKVESLFTDDISALVQTKYAVINLFLDSGITPIVPTNNFEFKSGSTLYYQYTVEDE